MYVHPPSKTYELSGLGSIGHGWLYTNFRSKLWPSGASPESLSTMVKMVLIAFRCLLTVFITILTARKSPIQEMRPSHHFLPVIIATAMILNQSISRSTHNTQDILSISILRLNQHTTLRIRTQVGPGQPVRHFNAGGHAVNLTMEDLLVTMATIQRVLST